MQPTNGATSWHQETVPAQYAYSVSAAAGLWDPDYKQLPSPSELLERYPVHMGRIPLLEFIQLCFQVHEQYPSHGIAYDIGWHLPPTAYGNLGYAMLCSHSLIDSVTVMSRFWPLITKTVSQFNWYEQDDVCVINLTLNDQLQGPLRTLWAQASLASWQRCIESMLGEPLDWTEYWFDFPEIDQEPPKQAQVGALRFDMPSLQFRFPAHYIKLRLPLANAQSHAVAVENCLKDIHFNGLDDGALLTKVKALLSLSETGYPSLENIADTLNVSSRTLRRQLSNFGYGYKSMLDQIRRQDAIRLLSINDLTVQQVSDLLGYSDPANFTRVFRQWTGLSPQAFRQQNQ